MMKGIVAVDQQNLMGSNLTMPWGDKPLDGKHFKSLTQGHIVVMGRKTFKSMGSKPLPNRLNIVLSSSPAPSTGGAENLRWTDSPDDILQMAQDPYPDVWIIGGRVVFETFLPYIQQMYVTCVESTFNGDVYFPDIYGYGNWKRETIGRSVVNSIPTYLLTFYRYIRSN